MIELNALKKIRIEKGLTQQEAAKRIGISYSLLSKMEAGYRGSSDKTKIKIAKFYNKTVGSLFFEEGITKRDNNLTKV
ncbi:helix-turn-helix transcriptional regulator [Listeria valentina]|uniref:helix-turn-helix transcriptional regulator n=1 Tax=Listeria valentina TaxID=2705293 RepID=UPI001431EE6A|nr:helix-turn-helix transcriptional regulator [Listeria valentina]